MVCVVLRERYLRTDIACGFERCPECVNISTNASLSYEDGYFHKSFPEGHVVLPDTNIFLHQVRLHPFLIFPIPLLPLSLLLPIL